MVGPPFRPGRRLVRQRLDGTRRQGAGGNSGPAASSCRCPCADVLECRRLSGADKFAAMPGIVRRCRETAPKRQSLRGNSAGWGRFPRNRVGLSAVGHAQRELSHCPLQALRTVDFSIRDCRFHGGRLRPCSDAAPAANGRARQKPGERDAPRAGEKTSTPGDVRRDTRPPTMARRASREGSSSWREAPPRGAVAS